jgi:hypothetical protein
VKYLRRDLRGEIFGNLKVLEVAAEPDKWGHTQYYCFCSICQSIKLIVGILLTTKVRPITRCCGRSQGLTNRTHGHTAHGKTSGIYRSYRAMLSRCTNPNQPQYQWYKDVGICKRWLGVGGFERFAADMGGFRPEGTTLGRRQDSGMYCKSRCSWQTAEQQRAERLKKRAQETGRRAGIPKESAYGVCERADTN